MVVYGTAAAAAVHQPTAQLVLVREAPCVANTVTPLPPPPSEQRSEWSIRCQNSPRRKSPLLLLPTDMQVTQTTTARKAERKTESGTERKTERSTARNTKKIREKESQEREKQRQIDRKTDIHRNKGREIQKEIQRHRKTDNGRQKK